MRKALFIVAISVSIAACSGSRDVEERVRFVATGVEAVAPKEFGDGITLTSARAEGRTLVLAFRGIGGDPKLATEIKRLVCNEQGYRDLIDKGAAIHFEMTSFDGVDAPPVAVESCDA